MGTRTLLKITYNTGVEELYVHKTMSVFYTDTLDEVKNAIRESELDEFLEKECRKFNKGEDLTTWFFDFSIDIYHPYPDIKVYDDKEKKKLLLHDTEMSY